MLIDLTIIILLLLGVAQFRTPPGARRGNMTAAVALAAALAVVLFRHRISGISFVVIAAVVGVFLGAWVAVRVTSIQIPAMVALQHGAGGVAAFLVSFVELNRIARAPMDPVNEIAALLGLFIGAATFSGSMIASGKLASILPQRPKALRWHNGFFAASIVAAVGLAVWAYATGDVAIRTAVLVVLLVISIGVGVIIAIRVGGADMPVLISFLNATAGLAAALCGVAIQNRLLIACGATVAASGSVLTHVMCRGMNRGLSSVFTGVQAASRLSRSFAPARTVDSGSQPLPTTKLFCPSCGAAIDPYNVDLTTQAASCATCGRNFSFDERRDSTQGQVQSRLGRTVVPLPQPQPPAQAPADPLTRAVDALRTAQRIIIVPGYGMALAEAQEDVVQLAEQLTASGKDVKFAIHPVAGRMPGHMHVVLAEAELDYSKLFEMKDVNDDFARADVALVVGACDVVNPAAIHSANTPISGMPILKAHEARNVIVCNLDERPGYSGVDNPLYKDPKSILLFGDAKETVSTLRQRLQAT